MNFPRYFSSKYLVMKLPINTKIKSKIILQFAKMSSKNLQNSKPHKMVHSQCQSKDLYKSYDSRNFSRIWSDEQKRIMNYSLIKIEGIPKNLAQAKELKSQNNFGRYGHIKNIYISNSSSYQKDIYITYDSELSASLAFLATYNCELNGEKLLVNFGTTKYCKNFLNDCQCQNFKCFYLHALDQENQSNKPQHAKQKHLQRAFKIIKVNLVEAIQMESNETKQKNDLMLRPISLILNKMIKNNQISEKDYQKARYKKRQVSQKTVLIKKNQNMPEVNMSSSQLQEKDKVSLQFKQGSMIEVGNQQNSKIKQQKTSGQYQNEDWLSDRILKRLSRLQSSIVPYSRLPFAKDQFLKLNKYQQMQAEQKVRKSRALIISLLSK